MLCGFCGFAIGSRQLVLRGQNAGLERSLVPAALRLYRSALQNYKVKATPVDFTNGSALQNSGTATRSLINSQADLMSSVRELAFTENGPLSAVLYPRHEQYRRSRLAVWSPIR